MALVGTGITIVFATSAFSAEILQVEGQAQSRPSIPTSHMSTPNNRHTFTPGKLVDPGGLRIQIAYNPDTAPPIDAAAETITVTYPLPAGMSTPANDAFSGFLTEYEWTGPLEGRMTANVTVKASGVITKTPAAA